MSCYSSSCPVQYCPDKTSVPIRPNSLPVFPVPFGLKYCSSQFSYNDTQQPYTNTISTTQHPINDVYTLSDEYTSTERGWSGTNPLLVNNVTGDRILLDRPHYHTGIPKDIHSPEMRHYGKYYSSYKDISAGDIRYWYPDHPDQVYSYPVYTLKNDTRHILRRDPMGGIRPEYPRTLTDNKIICDRDTTDTLRHREDLISLQSRKRNEQSYEHRWNQL